MKILASAVLTFACVLPLAAPSVASAEDAPFNLRRTTVVDVVEKTKNAVVYISSRKLVQVNPFGNDPFLRNFNIGPVLRPTNSLGSGFLVHPDGYIVTNNHVIDRARQISVQLLDDSHEYEAEVISADSESDLAILKIRADKPLTTLPLGDSSDLMIGEPVIAVGNPLGFSHSVSTGIVSAIHRDIEAIKLTDLIQTDAAINSGNSGGPLLNAYGQVIGINTAIVGGEAQNIGFAITVTRLRELIPKLLNPSQVKKLDIPIAFKEKRKLTAPSTVEASIVRADSEAKVLSIAGTKPRDIVDAYVILLRQSADRSFEVQLEGESAPLKLTPKAVPLPDVIVKARSKLGIIIEQITPMIAERYRLAMEDGLLVTEVERDSVAGRAGIQPGDVVLQLAQFRVATLNDLGYLLQFLPDSGTVPIGVARGRRSGFLRLQF